MTAIPANLHRRMTGRNRVTTTLAADAVAILRSWVMAGAGLAMGLLLAAPVRALPPSAMMPNGTYTYDASMLDNPYLRTTNFYGFEKLDTGDDERWSDLFGDFHLPILANIGIGAFYDDNVLINNLNRRSSFGTRLTPSLTLPMGSDKFFTTLNYSLMANVYENVSYANTVGNYLNANSTLEFDHRNRLTLAARGAFAQDPIGTMFTQGLTGSLIQTPSDWHGYGFDALYQYGAVGADGNLNLRFSMNNREYTNNLAITRQRDLNNYDVGGVFLWRVMPKTQILLEFDDNILDYLNTQNNGTSLDGSMYRAYTGATWEATAKTKAVVKVGYQWRTYTDSAYQTLSGPGFQGMLSWAPGSSDTVWAEISNGINEALIFNATSTKTQNYNINWRHQWLERIYTSLGAFYLQQQYTEANITNNSINGRIAAYYTFREGVWADLQYTYSERTSNQQQFDFNRNLVMLNVRVLF